MSTGRATVLSVASLALHAAFFAILTALPEPERARSIDRGDLIEVVRWPDDTGSSEVSTTARAAPPTAEPIPAPPRSEPVAAPVPRRDRARGNGPAAASPPSTPPAPTPAPGVVPAGERPSPHALALQGLRERSTARAQLTSPRVSAGSMGPAPAEPAAPGPQPPSSPTPTDDGMPRSLAEAGFGRNRKGEQVYRAPGGQFSAILLPDGRMRFMDHLVTASPEEGFAPRMAGLPELIRKAQKRELWAHDKAVLSRRTFELRLAIAVAFAESRIETRLKELYRDLLEIWQAERPAEIRRVTVFERWDECDETMRVKLPGFEDTPDTRIDALRKGAGDRARDTINAFVRRHAPEGSADGYSASELEALNRRRRSKARFAPYQTEPAASPPPP